MRREAHPTQVTWLTSTDRREVTPGRPRFAAPVVLAAILVSAPGCAGYQIGTRSLYPADIQTVYVPMFESDSFRRNLGERLTEAVCKQIERDTPYKVVSSPNADSVLSGRIVFDTKRVLVEDPFDNPRDIQTNFQVVVTWANRKGDLIQGGAVPLPPAFVDIGRTNDLIPEYGASTAVSEQIVIQRLAEQIVALMESPW
jgi:hypothetical protein